MFRPLTASMVLCAVFLVMTGSAATASPWPGGSTATDIGGDLPAGFEPSGIVWDDFTGALWVVDDEGQLARMLDDGTSTDYWTVSAGLDLEGVAVTGTTPKLYLGEEDPPTIREYNSSSTAAPTSTGKSWELGVPVTSGSGMEGLTWVPNGYHPYANSASGGVFFASSQSNGTIYVYDVNKQPATAHSVDEPVGHGPGPHGWHPVRSRRSGSYCPWIFAINRRVFSISAAALSPKLSKPRSAAAAYSKASARSPALTSVMAILKRVLAAP